MCKLLYISPRALQIMRENGMLAYTKASHKVYYKLENMKAVFSVAEVRRCIATDKGGRCNVANRSTSKPINQQTSKWASDL